MLFGNTPEERIAREADKVASLKEDRRRPLVGPGARHRQARSRIQGCRRSGRRPGAPKLVTDRPVEPVARGHAPGHRSRAFERGHHGVRCEGHRRRPGRSCSHRAAGTVGCGGRRRAMPQDMAVRGACGPLDRASGPTACGPESAHAVGRRAGGVALRSRLSTIRRRGWTSLLRRPVAAGACGPSFDVLVLKNDAALAEDAWPRRRRSMNLRQSRVRWEPEARPQNGSQNQDGCSRVRDRPPSRRRRRNRYRRAGCRCRRPNPCRRQGVRVRQWRNPRPNRRPEPEPPSRTPVPEPEPSNPRAEASVGACRPDEDHASPPSAGERTKFATVPQPVLQPRRRLVPLSRTSRATSWRWTPRSWYETGPGPQGHRLSLREASPAAPLRRRVARLPRRSRRGSSRIGIPRLLAIIQYQRNSS